jgi:ACR3 family arsenite efflux pump ArsB
LGGWVGPTAALLGVGWYFATCIILGIVLGRWADSASGLEPTFTLVGIVAGLAVALIGGIRMVMPVMRKMNADPTEKR